jgi:hypothetical protein
LELVSESEVGSSSAEGASVGAGLAVASEAETGSFGSASRLCSGGELGGASGFAECSPIVGKDGGSAIGRWIFQHRIYLNTA